MKTNNFKAFLLLVIFRLIFRSLHFTLICFFSHPDTLWFVPVFLFIASLQFKNSTRISAQKLFSATLRYRADLISHFQRYYWEEWIHVRLKLPPPAYTYSRKQYIMGLGRRKMELKNNRWERQKQCVQFNPFQPRWEHAWVKASSSRYYITAVLDGSRRWSNFKERQIRSVLKM
jgi:hypothetical protein